MEGKHRKSWRRRKRDLEFLKTYATVFPEDKTFNKLNLQSLPSGRRCTPVCNTPTERNIRETSKRTIGNVQMDPDASTSNCSTISSQSKSPKISTRISGDNDNDSNPDNRGPESEKITQIKRKVDAEDDHENKNDNTELRVHGEVDEEIGDANEKEKHDVQKLVHKENNHDDAGKIEEQEEKDKLGNTEGNRDNGTAFYCNDNNDEKNSFAFTRLQLWSSEVILKRHITNVDIVVQVLANVVRYNLTYVCMMQLLKMLGNMFVDSRIPRTIDGLWRLLARNDDAIAVRHYFCDTCQSCMGHNAAMLIDCMCGKYKGNGNAKLIPYFMNVRLAPQLRRLLETPTIYEALQYPRTRAKRNVMNMEDMYDGRQSKKLTSTANAFLSNPDNFSITINTDGCKVANSSNTSAWPILLQINELPPHLRKRYLLLGGIYVGKKHPSLLKIILPTVEELEELHRIGVVWKDTVDGRERISKIITTVCCVDTPARSDLLNMTRFNGRYGCTFCLHKGENSELRKKGPLVYPVTEEPQLRTHNEMRENMIEAHLSGKRINGVIGVSAMATLPSFDLATGVVVESMHNVYLGLSKLHTQLLFCGKATDQWYCGSPSTFAAVDASLIRIRRPSKIARSTRSMTEMKNWKANEWRNWLLYYAAVCMQSHIPDRYVQHLAKLSSAVCIFNNDSMSVHDLQKARGLIDDYVTGFQETFGKDRMKFNVHLLTHLPDTVENWGPLWAHSAFPFENWNKKIIDSVTSANARPLQIVTRHMMYAFMESSLYEESISDDTKEAIISVLYGGQKKGRKVGSNPYNHAFKFQGNGKSYIRAQIAWESEALQAAGFNNVQFLTGYRTATMRGINYECHDPSTTKTKNYCDEYIYSNSGFARIIDIVECTDESNNIIVHGFFVTHIESLGKVYETHHIHHVELVPADRRFISVDDKPPKPVVYMTGTDDKNFAVALCNVWESD